VMSPRVFFRLKTLLLRNAGGSVRWSSLEVSTSPLRRGGMMLLLLDYILGLWYLDHSHFDFHLDFPFYRFPSFLLGSCCSNQVLLIINLSGCDFRFSNFHFPFFQVHFLRRC